MNKFKYHIYYIFIIILATVSSYFIGNILNQKNIENSYYSAKDDSMEDTYKLFYGEWEITKMLSHRLGAYELKEEREEFLEKAEKVIGNRIKYSPEEFIYNDEYIEENPIYRIQIRPILNPNDVYIDKKASFGELGLDGDYFVFITIKGDVEKIGIPDVGSEFYIKDDDTLIAHYDDFYYELKRVSYFHSYGGHHQKL